MDMRFFCIIIIKDKNHKNNTKLHFFEIGYSNEFTNNDYSF